MSEESARITLPEGLDPVAVCGVDDACLRALEDNLPGVSVWARGQIVSIRGEAGPAAIARMLLAEMVAEAGAGTPLGPAAVASAAAALAPPAAEGEQPQGLADFTVLRSGGRSVRAKSAGQRDYARAIDNHDVVFAIGPAGTGKTYLAIAKAVGALYSGAVKRIVLTRPAVEAGESLGFLPGTLTQKIDPYVRPLYDALRDMVEAEDLAQLLESGTIEVAPLAYMRGRTLNDSFVILDEAQNTTSPQMKMFLTRLGFGSKMVITGDTSQVDLPAGTSSGLIVAARVLEGVEGLAFCRLSSADVVRHRLVGRMIDAWDQANHRSRASQTSSRQGRRGPRNRPGRGTAESR